MVCSRAVSVTRCVINCYIWSGLYNFVSAPFGREVRRILPSRADGAQGKLSCFLSHRLREVSWLQGGHMGLFCLYSGKCETCCMPVKSIDNWPDDRGFMAPRCCWRPRLRDTHKPFNQATFVTGPRASLLGTFPNMVFHNFFTV